MTATRLVTLTVDKLDDERYKVLTKTPEGGIPALDYLQALIAIYKHVAHEGADRFGEIEFVTAIVLEM